MNEPKTISDVKSGFFIGCVIHISAVALCAIAATADGDMMIPIFFIGLIQLVYMVPTLIIAQSKGSTRDFMKGLGLTMALVLIMNFLACGAMTAAFRLTGSLHG